MNSADMIPDRKQMQGLLNCVPVLFTNQDCVRLSGL